MTLLITGAGGQIGRELRVLARERNLPIRGLSRAELDITDAAAVDRAIRGAGLVINAAAYTAVDRAESERDAAFSVNRDGAAKLAAALRIASTKFSPCEENTHAVRRMMWRGNRSRIARSPSALLAP